MATLTNSLKSGLDRQIAGQIAYAKVTEVVQAKGKSNASSQSAKAKKSPKKATKKK
jgi:hypothetical protein